MRRLVFLFALLLVPAAAGAASDHGLQLGARAGFTLPVGSVTSGSAFNDSFTAFLPLGLEAGYRFDPNLYVGAFAEYGFGFTKNCPAGVDCAGHTLGFGIDLRYYSAVHDGPRPWIGLDAGYERLSADVSAPGAAGQSVAFEGARFIGLEAGLDFFVTPALAVGPYVSATLGEYLSASATAGNNSGSVSFDKALHSFLTLGLRMSFLP
jgi:outer membrane protein